MKPVLTVFLILLSLGLGVALLLRHKQAVKENDLQRDRISALERSLEDARTKLDDQERISLILRTNLNLTSQELQGISNGFLQVQTELRRTQSDFKATSEAAKAAQESAQAELAKKDSQINQLESQGNDLSTKINTLETTLGGLNKQIADTESKLAAAEGDREFLLTELKRLQTEKAELERQFNDLAFLRGQIVKLKEELSIARRLEWIRLGIYGASANKKGAELLMTGITPPAPRSNFNLNVELRQDGGATVVTNRPAAAP